MHAKSLNLRTENIQVHFGGKKNPILALYRVDK